MNKLIINGQVAVVHSIEFGCGFSSDPEYSDICFDPDVAKLVIDEDRVALTALMKSRYPDKYFNPDRKLKVTWLPIGTKFYINDYDGVEAIWTIDDMEWRTA